MLRGSGSYDESEIPMEGLGRRRKRKRRGGLTERGNVRERRWSRDPITAGWRREAGVSAEVMDGWMVVVVVVVVVVVTVDAGDHAPEEGERVID
jgi:hypothetical protein